MAELKTKLNDNSVIDFLDKVEDADKRRDSFEILKLMRQITGAEPKMWGDSIIGFGSSDGAIIEPPVHSASAQ